MHETFTVGIGTGRAGFACARAFGRRRRAVAALLAHARTLTVRELALCWKQSLQTRGGKATVAHDIAIQADRRSLQRRELALGARRALGVERVARVEAARGAQLAHRFAGVWLELAGRAGRAGGRAGAVADRATSAAQARHEAEAVAVIASAAGRADRRAWRARSLARNACRARGLAVLGRGGTDRAARALGGAFAAEGAGRALLAHCTGQDKR